MIARGLRRVSGGLAALAAGVGAVARTFELGGFGQTQSGPVVHAHTNLEMARKGRRMEAQTSFEERNNGFAKRAKSNDTRYVIGTGIVATCQSPKCYLQRVISQDLTTQKIDYAGKQNVYGLQRTIFKTMYTTGGVLVLKRYMPQRHRGLLPFKLQVLPQTAIANTSMVRQLESGSGNHVSHGIEFDEYGQTVAYYVNEAYGRTTGNIHNIKRIPADQIIHAMIPEEAGQYLGAPHAHASTIGLSQLSDWKLATVMVQKIASCLGVVFKNPTGSNFEVPEELSPGMIVNFNTPGEMETINPPQSQMFEGLAAHCLREAAAGVDQPYELFSQDLSKVNYLSARFGRQDYLGKAAILQQEFITQILEPLSDWVLQGIEEMGRVAGPHRITWTPPAHWLLNPKDEIPAMIAAMRGGLMSGEQIARESGATVDEYLNSFVRWNEAMDQKGIVLDSDPRKTTRNGDAVGSKNKQASDNQEDVDV